MRLFFVGCRALGPSAVFDPPNARRLFTLTVTEYIKKNLNVPNVLTVIRLLLVQEEQQDYLLLYCISYLTA